MLRNGIMPPKGGFVMEIIKAQKHKRHTEQERAELLNSYHCSGMSKKAWCEENGFAVSTLHKWLKFDKKRSDTKVTQNWAAITFLPQTKGDNVLLQAGGVVRSQVK